MILTHLQQFCRLKVIENIFSAVIENLAYMLHRSTETETSFKCISHSLNEYILLKLILENVE